MEFKVNDTLCNSAEIKENTNMNSNPGDAETRMDAETRVDGHESPLLRKVKYKIPTPTKSPTCRGDASPDARKQIRDKVQRLLENHKTESRTKRGASKIPVKAKDFKSKSEVSVSSIDRALQTLKAASEKRVSKIPVRIKDHRCCKCKFNDFLYNLRLSMRRLKHLEDERLNNLLRRLQDQNSKVSEVSESLKSLCDLEKSLKVLQTVSTLGLTEENNGAKFPFSTNVDSAEPIRDRLRNRPDGSLRWTTNFLKYALPSLIVVAVAVGREYLSELQCLDTQADCFLF